MVMISILGTGMVMLLANMAVLSSDYQQLESIASEAARQLASSRYAFGMARPEWVREDAEKVVKQCIDSELKVIGYEKNQEPEFEYRMTTIHRNGINNDIPAMYVECKLSVKPTPSLTSLKGLFFLCPHTVAGVSTDSENAIRRHAMALIIFVDPEHPDQQRGIRVPIYNYTRINNMASRPNMMKAGSSVGYFPNGTLRIMAKNGGWFKRDKSRRIWNKV